MEKIDSEKYYSAKEVCQMGVFGSKVLTFCVRRISDDMAGDNILKAEPRGVGTATRWYIKGENIIKFIKNKNEN